MQKTILVTGSTDGIGLETARMLVSLGHNVLLHGPNQAKLEEVEKTLLALPDGGRVESCVADLSRIADVKDHSVLQAMILAFENLKMVLEPSGAAAIAAMLEHADFFNEKRIVAFTTGGNITIEDFAKLCL
jgi:NAD(P)-dependent dehydrogenase (short-subunit alcohol dehydrogenase family)